MKMRKKCAAVLLAALLCISSLTGCGFFEMFAEEEAGEEGVYHAIYDDTNTDEELEAIPDVHLMKADIRDEIKNYGLSYEVTIAFDLESDIDATLSCYYYHNRNDESALDYCKIGMSYIGTYTMEGDKITFQIERNSYNTAICQLGSDYADLETFNQFSYAPDKGNGVWAYEFAPYDYEEEAEITDAILEGVPETIVFTVSGNKIVGWEAVE